MIRERKLSLLIACAVIGLLAAFSCINPSQAEDSDRSLAAIEARLARLEQRVAMAENGLGQVASYVSKGTKETRDTFRQIQADVKTAVDKFNSENSSIRQRLVAAESERKGSHSEYKKLAAEIRSLELRLAEAEGKMEKSTVSLKQVVHSANKNRMTRGRSVRRSNVQPGSRQSLINNSDDFGRRYQKILSEPRPYGARRFRPVTGAYDVTDRRNSVARSRIVHRTPGRDSPSGSHDVSGFYTRVNTEALSEPFRRLFRSWGVCHYRRPGHDDGRRSSRTWKSQVLD